MSEPTTNILPADFDAQVASNYADWTPGIDEPDAVLDDCAATE